MTNAHAQTSTIHTSTVDIYGYPGYPRYHGYPLLGLCVLPLRLQAGLCLGQGVGARRRLALLVELQLADQLLLGQAALQDVVDVHPPRAEAPVGMPLRRLPMAVDEVLERLARRDDLVLALGLRQLGQVGGPGARGARRR